MAWLCWPWKWRIKSQSSVRLTKLPKWHPVISSQSCKTTRFQTSGYMTIPSKNFSLVGYKKDSVRKGERFLLKGQSPSLFPLINFPFLAWLPSLLSFSLHLTYTMVFPVVMYGWESWIIKKAECWRIVVFELLEKTLESSLDSKEIKSVNLKGNQSWIFSGKTDAEAETPILWRPDAKN